MKEGRGGRASVKAALSSSYWRDDDARQVLEFWRASGLSLQSFAAQHGIGRTRLQRWKMRLEAETAPGPAFHPVQVVFDGQDRPDLADDVPAGRVELVLGNGRRVAVGPGFDGSVLEALVRVVESWAC